MRRRMKIRDTRMTNLSKTILRQLEIKLLPPI